MAECEVLIWNQAQQADMISAADSGRRVVDWGVRPIGGLGTLINEIQRWDLANVRAALVSHIMSDSADTHSKLAAHASRHWKVPRIRRAPLGAESRMLVQRVARHAMIYHMFLDDHA